MGNLKSIIIPREEIKLDDGQSFDVRAISTNDLMTLVGEHGMGLTEMFTRLQEKRGTGEFHADMIRDTILRVAREFPDVASGLIALASDAYDREGMALARELPFTVQVDALEKIFGLTFRSEGAVKKLMETLTKALTGVAGAMTEVSGFPSGTGVSGDNVTS